ncbi:hypothetical protein [Nocardia sp. CA-290969]|uniref:hypothetical protein n=1 Tax=Nocardia sp. CA-290969 TaxID=3239986 RepID=UPI003D8FEE53
MHIPAYEPDPGAELYDATALTDDPAFWSYHLCGTVLGAYEFFGVPYREFLRMRDERLTHPTRWPVLRIPLAGDHEIYIVYETYTLTPGEEYEYSVRYLLRPAGQERTIVLGAAEMEGTYGGLRWAELVDAATPAGTDGIQRPGARLLALLPMLADADRPFDAAEIVASALREQGATDPERQAVALLTEREFCGDETWTVDDAGVWTCDVGPNTRFRDDAGTEYAELAEISRALMR